MKKHQLRPVCAAFILAAVALLASCGAEPPEHTGISESLNAAVDLLAAVAPSAAPEETDQVSEAEQAAQEAYAALRLGDTSLLDDAPAGPERGNFIFLAGERELEYTTLDLDGDGVSELLMQWVENPCLYNAVFHYADGRLLCWNNDAMETSCRDYPLEDGTMVRQYDVGTGPDRYSHLYTLFRYQSNGEREECSSLTVHEFTGGGFTYMVDAEEVDKATFDAQFEEQITGQLLDRSAWTAF